MYAGCDMNLPAKYRLPIGLVCMGLFALLVWPFLTGKLQNSSLIFRTKDPDPAKVAAEAGQPLQLEPLDVANSRAELPPATPSGIPAAARLFGPSATAPATSESSGTNAEPSSEEVEAMRQQAALARSERLARMLNLDEAKTSQLVAISARYEEDRRRIRQESSDDTGKRKEMAMLTQSYRRDMSKLLENSDAARLISAYRQRIAKAQAAGAAPGSKQ